MTVVLDASAGMEIVLDRAKAGRFNAVLLGSDKVISSDLYKIEVASALWKYVKAKLLGKNMANKMLQLAQSLVDEFVDISENNEEAMNASFRLNHSTYDLLYFTLARRYSSKLVTLDKKLMVLAKNNGIEVVA